MISPFPILSQKLFLVRTDLLVLKQTLAHSSKTKITLEFGCTIPTILKKLSLFKSITGNNIFEIYLKIDTEFSL